MYVSANARKTKSLASMMDGTADRGCWHGTHEHQVDKSGPADHPVVDNLSEATDSREEVEVHRELMRRHAAVKFVVQHATHSSGDDRDIAAAPKGGVVRAPEARRRIVLRCARGGEAGSAVADDHRSLVGAGFTLASPEERGK